MLFCSSTFIFLFMPVFLLIYYVVPEKWSNWILFAGSLFFYGYGERTWFVLILISLLLHYTLVRFSAGKSRQCQTICLVILLVYGFGTLFVFKYLNFFADNWNQMAAYLENAGKEIRLPFLNVPQIELPLGISFYTFQIAAYAIDVYRKQVEAEKSFINLGAYLCMFPQLIAGPIVLYHQVSGSIKERTLRMSHMENGLKTFIMGLSLKMLLANPFGALWYQIQTAGISQASIPIVWLGALAYTFQIYFDFQGYSFMAMGLGEMLGFKIPRNFRHPYIAVSVTDFWRRWHMTLSGWFKNYVYIPLGGSRHGKIRMVLNMLAVWLFTGLWHGADWNFVLWGLYYFILLVLEKLIFGKWLEKHYVIGWLYTFTAVVTGWMIFAIDDLPTLQFYLSRMFTCFNQPELWIMDQPMLITYLRQYGLFFGLGILFSMPWPYIQYKKYKKSLWMVIVLFVLFLLCVYQIETSASNPFLYFRF